MAQGFEQERESPRANYPLKVSCLGDYQVIEARADNISLTGACLSSPVEYAAGQSLGLIVKLPGVRKLYAIPAEVVWSRVGRGEGGAHFRLGVKYLYLLPEAADNFRALLGVFQME